MVRLLAALALVVGSTLTLAAQPLSVTVANDVVRLRAPGFRFIRGEPLARLKDGRSVRLDFDLSVLPRPGAAPMARTQQRFIVSYDLWEERFAVTHVASPSRSISHLTTGDAETWCLDRISVPLPAAAVAGSEAPFWVRLEYRMHDDGGASSSGDENAYTLRGLVERLSRPSRVREWTDAIEAGPFRRSN